MSQSSPQGKRTKLSDISPEDLERAAKYLRELDASNNAKAAFELAKREQDVEIAKESARGKEADAQRAGAASQFERVRGEEQRRSMEAKRDNEKALMDYKLMRERENLKEADRLARGRDADKRAADLEDERMRAAIRRQAEEEIQVERRRTEEHRAKLERENMKARALAEAEGRIKESRENEDVFSRQLKLRSAEERTTRLDLVQSYFKLGGEYLGAFITDRARVTATVVMLTALAGGVYVSREGARVGAAVLQKRLLTPALVRETSRRGGHFTLARKLAQAVGAVPEEGYSLRDVVLRRDVEGRVGELSKSITSTRANKAPYRNLLFYGPPGTGKTMVAKRLARSSGMEYAILSGGDVGPLGRDAVTELHKLFDWASASKRGLLVFIDEADAFLASRSRTAMSEEQRNALNAVLFRTGEASDRFMLVLATNRPGDLDAAVTDRVDEAVQFGLPDHPARRKLVVQYFDKYVRGAGVGAGAGPFGLFTRHQARIPVADDVTPAVLDALAGETEGFSGRGIAKLMLSVQGTAYGRSGPGGGPATVTHTLLKEVLGWKVDELRAKAAFDAGDARYDFVATSHNTEGRMSGIAPSEELIALFTGMKLRGTHKTLVFSLVPGGLDAAGKKTWTWHIDGTEGAEGKGGATTITTTTTTPGSSPSRAPAPSRGVGGDANQQVWEDMVSALPPSDGRFVLHDWRAKASDGRLIAKLVLVKWCPDTVDVQLKMIMGSTYQKLKESLLGIGRDVQASDPSDLDYALISGLVGQA